MRMLTTLLLAIGFSATALAHALPGEDNPLQQLTHQVFSLHHLPALVVLLGVGGLLYTIKRQNRTTGKNILDT